MNTKRILICGTMMMMSAMMSAQSFEWTSSVEGKLWQRSRVSAKKSTVEANVQVPAGEKIVTFKGWGITFNELDWDALCMLQRSEQDEILAKIFSPNGDLRVSRGRVSMGANDYSRSWYSNDEFPGDLELRYFNIDRDRTGVIPFIRAAQKYNPDLTCWVSPWSPPSWMKINGDYPVLSSKYNNQPQGKDYILYGNMNESVDPDEMKLLGSREGVFPKKLATTDYFIQDSRYLQAYANLFCKFIDAYKAEGITIDRVIYQNEAYSYTSYPGCAWTAEGTIKFNSEYLGPTLQKKHPEVDLYLGTFNTNRRDYVEKICNDPALKQYVKGVGFQWEGREVLPHVRKAHPDWAYICSECECGWGSFDWKAGEHTFELINHYLGNGCNEFNIWNFILKDKGESPWGWKQNALIRVDSKTRTYTYTPEYYAVKHYAKYIGNGTDVVAYKAEGKDKMPVLVVRTPKGKYVVIAGNFNDNAQLVNIKFANGKTLSANLQPHSYNTFEEK